VNPSNSYALALPHPARIIKTPMNLDLVVLLCFAGMLAATYLLTLGLKNLG
jgi:hypothetical protein